MARGAVIPYDPQDGVLVFFGDDDMRDTREWAAALPDARLISYLLVSNPSDFTADPFYDADADDFMRFERYCFGIEARRRFA
jgi:hypothetical protein